jgi:hypothetical protein
LAQTSPLSEIIQLFTLPPWYSWNIVESGVKHHNLNLQLFTQLKKTSTSKYHNPRRGPSVYFKNIFPTKWTLFGNVWKLYLTRDIKYCCKSSRSIFLLVNYLN